MHHALARIEQRRTEGYKVHWLQTALRTGCGRAPDDRAVSGRTTLDPAAVTCGNCLAWLGETRQEQT